MINYSKRLPTEVDQKKYHKHVDEYMFLEEIIVVDDKEAPIFFDDYCQCRHLLLGDSFYSSTTNLTTKFDNYYEYFADLLNNFEV